MTCQNARATRLLPMALACAIALCGCGQAGTVVAPEDGDDVQEQAAEQMLDDASEPAQADLDSATDDSYQVEYGESELYTHEDIDDAIQAVMEEFGTWRGCTMKRLSFTSDDTCQNNIDYVNDLRDEGEPAFDEALVLTSDFHSPTAEEAEGTAWNPDTDYTGWSWILGRTTGGAWQLLTWGYA